MTGSLQIKKDKFYMVLNLTQCRMARLRFLSTIRSGRLVPYCFLLSVQ